MASTAISDVWAEARTLALTPARLSPPSPGGPTTCGMPRSPCGSTPGCPRLRLPTAGHSVEVLLRVYAKCVDGGDKVANMRIDAALQDSS